MRRVSNQFYNKAKENFNEFNYHESCVFEYNKSLCLNIDWIVDYIVKIKSLISIIPKSKFHVR